MTNEELITALEAATGQSRELDAEIYISVHIPAERAGRIDQDGGMVGWWPKDGPYVSALEVPRFTASIDDALALVPEGWDYCLSVGAGEPANVGMSPAGRVAEVHAESGSPALALCIAALRARSAQP